MGLQITFIFVYFNFYMKNYLYIYIYIYIYEVSLGDWICMAFGEINFKILK